MSEEFNYYRFKFLWGEYILAYAILLIIFLVVTMINLPIIQLSIIPYLVFFIGWIFPIILIYIIKKIIYKKMNQNEKIKIKNKKIYFPKKFNNKIISKNEIKNIELISKVAGGSAIFGGIYLFAELIKGNNSFNLLIFNLNSGEKITLSNRNLDLGSFSKELYYLHFDELFEKSKKYTFWG